jgi:hypothetical protein
MYIVPSIFGKIPSSCGQFPETVVHISDRVVC